MIVKKFNDEDSWKDYRKGKIGGTFSIMPKRGDVKLIGFYELIAQRVATPPDDENPMDRGIRLEAEALERFAKETKKKVENELIIWEREDNEGIYISPDGTINDTEAIEVKCISSAKHIKAFLTQEVPSDYENQVMQYFVVNEKLETLYFVFYDPRIAVKDFFYLTIKREDIQEKVVEYLEYQKTILEEVDEVVNKLTF